MVVTRPLSRTFEVVLVVERTVEEAAVERVVAVVCGVVVAAAVLLLLAALRVEVVAVAVPDCCAVLRDAAEVAVCVFAEEAEEDADCEAADERALLLVLWVEVRLPADADWEAAAERLDEAADCEEDEAFFRVPVVLVVDA